MGGCPARRLSTISQWIFLAWPSAEDRHIVPSWGPPNMRVSNRIGGPWPMLWSRTRKMVETRQSWVMVVWSMRRVLMSASCFSASRMVAGRALPFCRMYQFMICWCDKVRRQRRGVHPGRCGSGYSADYFLPCPTLVLMGMFCWQRGHSCGDQLVASMVARV